MKRLTCLAAATFSLLTSAGFASLPDLNACVTGAAQAVPCVLTDSSLKGSDKSENITNESLFAEFDLTPNEYALVLSFTDSALEFVPLSASSTKPKIKVFTFGPNTLPENSAGRKDAPTGDKATIDKAALRMVGQVTLTGTLAVAANLSGQQFHAAIYALANGPVPADGSPLSLRLAAGKVFTQRP